MWYFCSCGKLWLVLCLLLPLILSCGIQENELLQDANVYGYQNVDEVVIELGNKASYERKWRLIDQAETSVSLATLIYQNDYSSSHLSQRLLEKARDDGVQVRLLIDWARALPLRSFFKMLMAKSDGKIQVGYFRPVTEQGLRDLQSFGVRDPQRFLEGILTPNWPLAISGYTKNPADQMTVQSGAVGFFGFLKQLELHPATWWNFSKRLHHKLITVDGQHMLGGGRNIQDVYHWDYDHPVRLEDSQASQNDLVFMDADFTVDSPLITEESQLTFDRYWQCGLDPQACVDSSLVVMEEMDLNFDEIELAYAQMQQRANQYQAFRDFKTPDPIQDKTFIFPNVEVNYLENSMMPLGSRDNKLTIEENHFQLEMERIISELGAGEEIILHNAYVYFSSTLLLSLMKAIKTNGNKLTIITNSPESSNHGFVSEIGRYQYVELLKLGKEYGGAVKIYEYQTDHTLHNKVSVLGNQHLMISGVNADPRSQFLDTNNGISISSENAADEYRQWVRTLVTGLEDQGLIRLVSLEMLSSIFEQRHQKWQALPFKLGDRLLQFEGWMQTLVEQSFIDPLDAERGSVGTSSRYVLDRVFMQL